MAQFSERYGFRDVGEMLQREAMTDDLRVNIWNAIVSTEIHTRQEIAHVTTHTQEPRENLQERMREQVMKSCRAIWQDVFRAPIDNMPINYADATQDLKEKSYELHWYEVYDVIESLYKAILAGGRNPERYTNSVNHGLSDGRSVWRLIDGELVPIANEMELSSVQTARNSKHKSIQTHINTALEMLCDRSTDDYRNCVNESISAVEAACRIVAGKESASLSDALNKLQGQIPNHTALISAWKQLYGYTSDAGIRHAVKEGHKAIDFPFAKYMLVSCSAFVNYLTMLQTDSVTSTS